IDPPLLAEFLQSFRGKTPAVYSQALSGPVWHIPLYPAVFAPGSAFFQWLDQHPERRFAILLNYGEPQWPQGADARAVLANLQRYQDRFIGYIAGENLAYAPVDGAALEAKIRAA